MTQRSVAVLLKPFANTPKQANTASLISSIRRQPMTKRMLDEQKCALLRKKNP